MTKARAMRLPEVAAPDRISPLPMSAPTPQVLIPWNPQEAISVKKAAELAGVSLNAMYGYCKQFHIGRAIFGGHIRVSKVALQMRLDDNEQALALYLAGDRTSETVRSYFRRCKVALECAETTDVIRFLPADPRSGK